LEFDELVNNLKDKSQKELLLDEENRENVKLLGHILLVQKIDGFKHKLWVIKNKICWWKNGNIKKGKND
jgi:hypothetical protein